MSKRARWRGIPDKDKHEALYVMAKKTGRSSGPLVEGVNGVMVTPKVHRAQLSKRR